MAAILNSAILDSAILDSHLKLHSFKLTQLEDGSHLEFCHLGFSHCHLGFRHLVIFSQIQLKKHSNSLQSLTLLFTQAIIQSENSDSNSFLLKLIWWWAAILNSANLNSTILLFSYLYTHSHLPRLVPTICTKNFTHNLPRQSSWILLWWIPTILHKKKLHSFILTQLDDGSHLEFCHLGFRHCHLGFRHLVIFSQIHLKMLSLLSDSYSTLIQSDSNSFILT